MTDTKTDPRILFQTPHFRVVAPDAKLDGGTLRINGKMIIERATTDVLGAVVWRTCLELTDPKHSRGDGTVYNVLASIAGGVNRDWGLESLGFNTRG